MPMRLLPEQLYRRCDPTQFSFQLTSEINDFDDIIGQDRAVAAIRFGIGIQHEGFNLYALGANGTGKLTSVSQYLSRRVENEPTPNDWCYVYNFAQPHKPIAVQLPSGRGVQFREDIKRLVKDLATVIPAAFSGDDYSAKKKAIVEELKAKESEALDALKAESEAKGIAFIRTSSGVAFAPLHDGEVMSPDAFLQLPSDLKNAMEKEVSLLQDKLQEVMSLVPQWHREVQKHLQQLHDEAAAMAIDPLFAELGQKYAEITAVLTYLESVKSDVVANIDEFVETEDATVASMMGISAPKAKRKESAPTRYEVNVIVDHSKTKGAP
ncbi:MAG: AAA family ATPase, partial [Anaerolineales bacterium]|nr:AAA family ATPase [Anaerolineales bacterium]